MSLDYLLFQDQITLSRETVTKDTSGGAGRTWAALYSHVPARVIDADARQAGIWYSMQMTISHVVYTQQDGAQNGDLVTTSDGRTLRVEAVRKWRVPLGAIGNYWVWACNEIRSGT